MEIPFNHLAAANRPFVEDLVTVARDIGRTARFVGGPYVERFEQLWAQYCGTRHAVGVANGTDALELTLRALGIGEGDDVLLPANTFIATAEAVSAAGAVPRFADVDPDSLLVTPGTLEAARTPRTAAVIAVHLYGHPADMPSLRRYAARHGLALVEDAAQAHGALLPDGPPAGAGGHAGCFSFYPSKNLGAWGDAGAVVTDDETLADTIRSLADHGRDDDSRHHHIVGRNSRLDAFQAAVLTLKLRDLDRALAQRRRLVNVYRAALGPLADTVVTPEHPETSAWHLMVVRVTDRDQVRRQLRRAGVGTGVHYPVPCHLTPAYLPLDTGPLPVAEAAAAEVLSLPLWPEMPVEYVERVAAALHVAVARTQADDHDREVVR